MPTASSIAPQPTAVLELTDHAPLQLLKPVRSLVWFRGRLRPVPAPLVPALLGCPFLNGLRARRVWSQPTP